MGNNIQVKSVNDLKGMKFFIPRYQRGYRWTVQQVNDLLDDLYDFCINSKSDFYCLQPLVVKKREHGNLLDDIRKAESIDKVKKLLRERWEVIDGQQRLTTLYIILGVLGIHEPFLIEYETRSGSADFLKKITDSNHDINENESEENIDYHYMWRAKGTVNTWIDEKKDIDKERFKEKILSQVKFIWYESVEEDPINVFTRLNIGKIALTNSELIKALFLNRSNFQAESKEQVVLRQREIANEWDEIEYTLQNDEVWYFLHDTGYNRPTRIDFIFDLICKQDTLQLKLRNRDLGTDSYRTFRYFNEYFKRRTNHNLNDESRIDACWKEVKKYYMTFMEWYNDLELYHYIGFLIHTTNESKLNALMDEWWKNTNSKSSFSGYLKEKISTLLIKTVNGQEKKTPILDFQYKEDGSDKYKCKPILLFHNIQTVINQNRNNKENEKYQLGVFYKFPFHLYKREDWDVEHINPSTLNELDNDKDREEWLLNMYFDVKKETQELIQKYFYSKSDATWLNVRKAIESELPEPVEWDENKKNQIWNYALLDSSTNRSYGNAIFSGKRRVIVGKDKGVLIPLPQLTKDGKLDDSQKETPAKSAFVPPCTRNIFLKYYSSMMGNANFWTIDDAEAYKEDIQNCIDKLVGKDEQ